jgi:hypothetical protein
VNIGSQPSRIWPPVRLEGAKQVITMFVAEAYNVEIAITNELFPTATEEDPNCNGCGKAPKDAPNRTIYRPAAQSKLLPTMQRLTGRFSKPALFVASAVLRPHAPSHGRTSCINAMPGTQRRGPRPRRP